MSEKDSDDDMVSMIGKGLGAMVNGFIGMKTGSKQVAAGEEKEIEPEEESENVSEAMKDLNGLKGNLPPAVNKQHEEENNEEENEGFVENNIRQNMNDDIRSNLAKPVPNYSEDITEDNDPLSGITGG